MKKLYFFLFLFIGINAYAQKDSLQLGDRYSDDQIYASIAYNQFYNQPDPVTKSNFSFGVSAGFMKDIILNKKGSISIALGTGYGFDSFNHKLKVDEVSNQFVFGVDDAITSNKLITHNLEFPLELRWRTSTVNKYKFWRIYTGIKFSYNLSNNFNYNNAVGTPLSFNNIPAYNKWQYGITLSAGYDAFNIQVYYGITPILENASIGGESINTKILKFGLIFYIL